MKKNTYIRTLITLRFCIATFILVIISLFLFSFTVKKMNEEFLKQLGISQEQADSKITGSLLSGSLDYYGIRNLQNILVNDRPAIVKSIAQYAKQYVNSEAFKKEYELLRNNNKPAPTRKMETPEEMRANMIKMAKDYFQTAEEGFKKATPEMKKIYEQMVETAKKNLKDAEDPSNAAIKAYTENYESMKTMMQQSYDNNIHEWEAKYPANHLLYIKAKLQTFLDATAGIDFSAQLREKNGKKYFVNPVYESKDNRWKLAFRAGKETVEAARAFAKQWMDEIK